MSLVTTACHVQVHGRVVLQCDGGVHPALGGRGLRQLPLELGQLILYLGVADQFETDNSARVDLVQQWQQSSCQTMPYNYDTTVRTAAVLAECTPPGWEAPWVISGPVHAGCPSGGAPSTMAVSCYTHCDHDQFASPTYTQVASSCPGFSAWDPWYAMGCEGSSSTVGLGSSRDCQIEASRINRELDTKIETCEGGSDIGQQIVDEAGASIVASVATTGGSIIFLISKCKPPPSPHYSTHTPTHERMILPLSLLVFP